MIPSWTAWLLVPAAYLLGSLSPAYWAGRVNGIDLRQHGSRNLGATNAGRVLGRRWFFIVFGLDVLKGWTPVAAAAWIAARAGLSPDAAQALALATAVAAVLGHSFTCFHGFKGGKAVATSFGILIGLTPVVAAGCLATWLVVWLVGIAAFRAKATAAVGLASVASAIAAPSVHFAVAETPWRQPTLPLTVFLCALSLLVLIRHHRNIARMLGRGEPPPPAAA